MKKDKMMFINYFWIIIGTVLISLGIAEKIDSFWSSMGSPLILIGTIRLIRTYRLQKNDSYREKLEIAASDERNHFIKEKAWAWTGYIYILITAILVIVFKIVNQELLSFAASISVCLMLNLYWVSYFIIRKKY